MRGVGDGVDESPELFYVQEAGEWIRWSSRNGSHVGRVKEEVI